MKNRYLILLGIFCLFILKVSAVSAEGPAIIFDKFDVDFQIHENTAVDIEEKIQVTVNGNFHGLRRDILTDDYQCKRLSTGTCGGFDYLFINRVTDLHGADITNKVRKYQVEDDSGKYFRIEWEIYKEGKNVENLQIGWIINYTVWGSIKFFDDGPVAYWNLLPHDKSSPIGESNIKIYLPEKVMQDQRKFKLYSSSGQISSRFLENYIELTGQNISKIDPLTFSYKFNVFELQKPGYLHLNVYSPLIGYSVYLDSYDITDLIYLKGKMIVPVGNFKLRISHSGYFDYLEDLIIGEGAVVEKDIKLQPYQLTVILNTINQILICMIPVFILLGISVWYLLKQLFGIDKGHIKTIYPMFNPPDNYEIVCTNTLLNKKYNHRDITAQIIMLCVKGYIKIESFNKQNITLMRTEKTFSNDILDSEKIFIDILFGDSKTVITKNNDENIAIKIKNLENHIHRVVEKEKIFTVPLKQSISKYSFFGLAVLLISMILLFLTGLVFSYVIGHFSTFYPLFICVTFGLLILMMPTAIISRTQHGSLLLNQILGFKMYLNAAERFTLENLKVEEFEKNLPYAVALGVEKSWTNRFGDHIKDLKVKWIEDGNLSYIYIDKVFRQFDSTLMSYRTYTRNSVSGSGWSTGYTFSGSSGKGGGGGRAGGW